MNHAALFNGIGGFQLAASWMGWNNVISCEIDEFCNKVTKYHFPNCIQYGDIKKTDFTIYRGRIDIITGGFPCQPYSAAGKRKGKEDDRHLWPEMLRAIREIQPRWVVGENVSGLLNWNRGMVLDEIKADLEAAGFEVFPPLVLPACAVNAPHRRDRVWIVAHSKSYNAARSGNPCNKEQQDNPGIRSGLWNKFGSNGQNGDVTNTEQQGLEGFNDGNTEGLRNEGAQSGAEDSTIKCDGITDNANSSGWGQSTIQSKLRAKEFEQLRGNTRQTGQAEDGKGQEGNGWKQWAKPNFDNFPTQSPVCSRDDEFPGGLDGITFSKWRNESIKAYGNAIVPQVAFEIFKALDIINRQHL